MVESWGSTRISSTSPPSSGPPPPLPLPISNSAHGTTVAQRSGTTMTNAAPIASPEGVSDVSKIIINFFFVVYVCFFCSFCFAHFYFLAVWILEGQLIILIQFYGAFWLLFYIIS